MSTDDSDRQPPGRVDDMYVGILGGNAQETRAALSSPRHAVNGHVTGLKAACLLERLKPQQHPQDEQSKSMNSFLFLPTTHHHWPESAVSLEASETTAASVG